MPLVFHGFSSIVGIVSWLHVHDTSHQMHAIGCPQPPHTICPFCLSNSSHAGTHKLLRTGYWLAGIRVLSHHPAIA